MLQKSLPPLREELTLYPGPRDKNGAPSWTIHDPPRNAFFSISWLEFEILHRWSYNNPEKIVAAVNRETALNITEEHIHALLNFLIRNNLVIIRDQAAVKRFLRIKQGMQNDMFQFMIKNYLFFRIPLLNPDRFLERTYPFIKGVFSRLFILIFLIISGVDIYLISRQWDVFLSTFSRFFSFNGFLIYAFAITFCKIIHELGHAYTAKRFGCRVPTIGIAFLVLWPVLYTDTTEAWKLSSFKKRLAIGSAGIITETGLAVLALLLWNILPDGTLRSTAFVVSTSAWLITIAINLNPFMKYDGYYILSDLLHEPNLQSWAFRIGKWWIREKLFGINETCPGSFTPAKRIFLIVYAIGIWLYRFFLFLGIALLVYKLFFKLLGIILFILEIFYFILLPVYREFASWWALRDKIHMTRHTITTIFILLILIGLVAFPWQRSLNLPAVYQAGEESTLFSPFASRVNKIDIETGMHVNKNQTLVELASPDLEHNIEQAKRNVDILKWQLDNKSLHNEFRERSLVIESELDEALIRLQGLVEEKERLEIKAPFSGKIAEISDSVQEDQMVMANEPLLLMVPETGIKVEAYVNETDLMRIQSDKEVSFYPDIHDFPILKGKIIKVEKTATRFFNSAYLASPFGGTIPVKIENDTGRLIPVDSIYRLHFDFPANIDAPAMMYLGNVRVNVKPESILNRIRRRIVALIIRESGF
ncbi:MAG: HlyD family efflux transporter periplasmic adaptor subunit [Desulfobacteraceae bacterium]